MGSERGASGPCTRSGNVTDVRGGTNDIWDGTSLLLRLSLRGDLLRNLKLKWVSNTISISYDKILIWKTYFRYQKRHNLNLSIIFLRYLFAERVIF
jgi:hypothetical protein